LEDALDSADFVIAVNYQGVAILNSYLREKPVLLYWCNEGIGCTSPFEYSNMLMNGGEVIDSFETLKEYINLLIRDKGYGNKLNDRSINFKKNKLNDKYHQYLPDIVEKIIAE
jgi:hypothetical protein